MTAHVQTDKNEPGRFLGEGVAFRAKLIGVLEVPEARGDRMCQEALADLKMAIRAAGEHKQRIQVHVAIDGLRLRDDKTGDSLYHHPVHKISFIAQDMTDSRAFGYIFGSPDTGHRFFGIKTDKAASQVVIAMRDLFQVVFELKKKEIEMAKQQLEGKSATSGLVRHSSGVSSEAKSKVLSSVGEGVAASKPPESGEGGVAELVDLEQELSSLRRGLTQVEGLTPSADPFGDSFIVPPSGPTKTLLPPPPSGSSTRGRNTPSTATTAATATARSVFSPSKPPSLPFSPSKPPSLPVFSPSKPSGLPFDLATVAADLEPVVPSAPALVDSVETVSPPAAPAAGYDVFTELDPLGTGRSRPYVDKKLFFQELKNPPKKVLKDLVPPQGSLLTDMLEPDYTMTSLSRHSGGSVSISKQSSMYTGGFFASDPFADADPFDSADPFSDAFKDDPFAQEAPRPRGEEPRKTEKMESATGMKSVFNGPLQVSLPPEPAPKSPRLQRQATDTSSIRQRPTPSSKLASDSASPPPPLPPKKTVEVSVGRPPPRPPTDQDSGAENGPPLPPPARKKEPLADRSTKPRLSSLATNSSSDEYLAAAPPPLPAPRRFDITLAQLLTCSQQQLAERLRVPEKTLSSMTLPQLTAYLRSYLASDADKAHIHVESMPNPNNYRKIDTLPSSLPSKPPTARQDTFEDNFTSSTTQENSDTFVANFDDFEKKASSSYDRYAAFREIQEQELKTKSLLNPLEDEKTNGEAYKAEDEEEMTSLNDLVASTEEKDLELKETNPSPLRSLEELTMDSFNMFRKSVSPKPSKIDSKIEDIKNVMKTLQIEHSRRSVSPRDSEGRNSAEPKTENANDRYAALREITITSPPPDEFESLPSEAPKERKRSEEKSDGFDNSDFFDCIDNSSLSFSHVDDAFRKSPVVPKEKAEKEKVEKKVALSPQKEILKEKREVVVREPARELQPPPRLSTGSMSDVASASSPDTKEASGREVEPAGRWSVLAARASPWSSDSRDSECAGWRSPPPAPAPRARRRHRKHRQTSSSSRDVSPWEEEPPAPRLHRPPSHHRDSRHTSSQGSRECLDSGSGRDKDKMRDRGRDLSRDGRDSVSTRESMRDRRDSGSGRDRALSKDSQRARRSRDREPPWERDRDYRDYRDSRSREPLPKDYREPVPKDYREPVPKDYREPLPKEYRESLPKDYREPLPKEYRESLPKDYREPLPKEYRESLPKEYRESLPKDYREPLPKEYRESLPKEYREPLPKDYREHRDRPRKHHSQSWDDEEDYSDGCGSGRSSPRERWPDQRWRRDERHYGSLGYRESRRRTEVRQTEDLDRRYGATLAWANRRPVGAPAPRRDPDRRRRQDPRPRRLPTDYPHDRDREQPSPFDNDFVDTGKKRGNYSSLEGARFAFEQEETTASPVSASSARARDGDAGTRFRFDSDSVSPRSMFEDDFTAISTPRARAASIAEEDEGDLPPLRTKTAAAPKDLKKSESVNIFVRDSDPFAGDDFFACTGSDRAARRDNWPGDFQAFDNV